MKRGIYTAITFCLFSISYAFSQNNSDSEWTLENCIQYAIDHNIGLKQKELEKANRKIELNTSELSWLPNLNARIGQDYSYGRSETPDGTITSINSANSSFNINTGMPLFDGFKIPNTIAARKLDLLAATESLNKAKDDLSIGVTSYFLQVLYNKEILHIAELQIEVTQEQVTKTEALVNSGKVPLSQLYDIKAQLAKDEATRTEAKNNVSLALLDLSQSLELERLGNHFNIISPEINDVIMENISSIIPPDDIYEHAVSIKPQIKEQDFLLQSQKKMLRVAQADLYPKLSFGANYRTGYYRRMGGDNNNSFSDQLKDNAQQAFGFTLDIPLFNRLQVLNSVRSSKIAIKNQELMMESSKKVLYKEIQQAYFNATAAQEKYISSKRSVEATKEAYTYAEERYAAGKSTAFEYNESKTKYAQSLSEQAQAKYSFIFRTKILDFYNGIPITL